MPPLTSQSTTAELAGIVRARQLLARIDVDGSEAVALELTTADGGQPPTFPDSFLVGVLTGTLRWVLDDHEQEREAMRRAVRDIVAAVDEGVIDRDDVLGDLRAIVKGQA